MKISYYFFTILLILTSACSDRKSTPELPSSEPVEKHATHPATAVELNQGSKWIANPETTKGIENMLSLINHFSKNPQPADYVKLKKDLESEFTLILQRCTMKGEAHSQLHNFLVPAEQMISGIASDDTVSDMRTVQALKNHLESFQNYFMS